MRKYDTLIHLPVCEKGVQLSDRQRMIIGSKNHRIVEVGEAVSPSPLSIITR